MDHGAVHIYDHVAWRGTMAHDVLILFSYWYFTPLLFVLWEPVGALAILRHFQ